MVAYVIIYTFFKPDFFLCSLLFFMVIYFTQAPRTAHPVLRFACVDTDPLLVPNFPYDKYELEPSPLTQVLLEKKNPNICWQVNLKI